MLAGCDLERIRGPRKLPVVGYLFPGNPEGPGSANDPGNMRNALQDGLLEHGLVEGRDLVIEYRYAAGDAERLPRLATELLDLGVHLIVANGPTATAAARKMTDRVPIVTLNASDPVAAGWAASLSRPGGNVTGATNAGVGLFAKSVELLSAVVPNARRLMHMTNLGVEGEDRLRDAVAMACEQLGLHLLVLDVPVHAAITPAFERAREWGADAAVIRNLPPMNAPTLEPVLTEVKQTRLPAVSSQRFWVNAGLLMMLQTSTREQGVRGAAYIARILRGANPADLPIFRATTFELLINRSTLTNLGLSVPSEVEAQVTEWIPG
jgi:putative ABC transport system substrate-binding protein